ncbi:3'-5' exonuclease [Clostridium sp. KNHs214]|uniref:3'-5' exonuclease n=1 Tax=Clostridium sp. KNHs214 TaxID=1540257 RepID=UPI00055857CE|nr:3'-5' exonuclease [Clostridium sp. KNHs214]
MNYIIFDLEFNQGWDKQENKVIINSKNPFEIIQIGAVKLDENLNMVSSFNRLVKPKTYRQINPYVRKITNISMKQLNEAEDFKNIWKKFMKFFTDDRNVLGVWGTSDIKELLRNIEYHKLDSSIVPREYINIQYYASKYFNLHKGKNIGLKNAVELLNITVNNEFHDAFYDACYTVEVFKKIYNEKIQPQIYNPPKRGRKNRYDENKEVDFEGLIKQFEKMFQRKMSPEEKSMIKLAYIMGKTNQFLKESKKKE